MKKIAIILIIGLLAISVVYAEQTTKTYHVTDKKILSGGYEQNYGYVIETQEDGDIIINAKDYTIEQLNVWATGEVDLVEWNTSFLQHFTVVAVEGEQIVGFGDIDKIGYLDRLYVHKDYPNDSTTHSDKTFFTECDISSKC